MNSSLIGSQTNSLFTATAGNIVHRGNALSDNLASRTKISRLIWCLVVLFLCVYCGAYWALVRQGLSMRGRTVRMGPVYANQRGTQKALETLFWPVHQVDRVIRSSLWRAELSDVPMMEAH